MNHLPDDILVNIFQHVPFQSDKIECMLVSRHWKKMMEYFVLYQTTILYSPERLGDLLEQIRKYPNVASNIEELLVLFRDLEYCRSDLSHLLSLLHNLKTFSIPRDWNGNGTIYSPIKHPWCDSIVEVLNEQSNPFICSVLPLNVCPSLTSLAVSIDSTGFLSSLKYAYSLKSLTLSNGLIGMNDLEMIHTNVHYLQSLALVSVCITNADFDQQNTLPATLMHKLALQDVYLNYVALGARPLIYFVLKYPNLVDLDFRVLYFGRELEPDTLNHDVWIPMFNNLGPKLKNLCIDYRHEKDNLYQRLDASGCQLSQLKISPFSLTQGIALANSQQVHFIKRLLLLNVQCQDYTWLKTCVALEELKISMPIKERDTNFTDILANVPVTLRSLTIKNARLYFDPNFTCISQLNTLCFKNIVLPVSIDTFIDQHFPNLLELEVNRWPRNERVLNLPSLNLNTFRFSAYNGSLRDSVIINTLNNSESRMYSVPLKVYRKLVPERFCVNGSPFRSYLLDKSNYPNDEPDITLYCHSVKDVYFK